MVTNTLLLTTFHDQFTEARLIRVWVRVRLYESEIDRQPVLILDDGSINENREPAVKVLAFESEAERQTYLDQKYPYTRSTDPALSLDERMIAADVERHSRKRVCLFCEG